MCDTAVQKWTVPEGHHILKSFSHENPDLLTATIPQLMNLASTDTVSQIRWHIAEVFGNVPISEEDAESIIPILFEYLNDKSKIVKYCAVQTLGILGKASSKRKEIIKRISILKDESKGLAKAVHKALDNLRVGRNSPPEGNP